MDAFQSLSDMPRNQPIPWRATYKGQECPGDLILGDRWREEWGQSPSGDSQFRIVILTEPQEIPATSLADPRIAVCLPSPGRALRERPATYPAVTADDVSVYRSGTVISQLPLPPGPEEVFSLPDNRRRFDLLARALLTVNDVQNLRAYLDATAVPQSERELALDRLSILEQLVPARLLANPHLWSSLEAMIDWFRSRYRPLYLNHHHAYHRVAAALHDRLAKAEPELAALRRLNYLAELGPPVGESLFSQYEELEPRLRPCGLWETATDPETPCSACGLKLSDQLPQRGTELFLNQLEAALGQQLRRLSSQAIRQILAQSHEARVEQFLKIVQASDLTSLINVLDDALVGFLRQLLTRQAP